MTTNDRNIIMTKKKGMFSWFGRGAKEDTAEQEIQELPSEVNQVNDTAEQVSEVSQQSTIEVNEANNEKASEIANPLIDKVMDQVTDVNTQVLDNSTNEESSADVETVNSELNEPNEPIQVVEEQLVEKQVAVVQQAEPLEIIEPSELIEKIEEPVKPAEKEKKLGLFARLKAGLTKTRQNLGGGLFDLFRGKKIDDDLFEELETHLLMADVGVETTTKIIDSLIESADRKQLKDAEALYDLLKAELAKIIAPANQPLTIEKSDSPYVILMVGVNGVGKTTTIGKLAKQLQAQGKSVMLAAGDTFRAAAVEQLQVWGERNDIPVIAQHTGADSASVIFDAISAAKARGADVLIADTAGRLQNKSHLMEELKKVVRVMKKLDVNAPHEVMLTLDAGTGQNALSQVNLFNEAVNVTGITLSKLDGTAKGGVIFAIADKFKTPIRFLGVGEGIDDLRPFIADDFIDALFEKEE